MTIDWQRLIRVRERGRTAAVDVARREAEVAAQVIDLQLRVVRDL